MLLQYQYYNVIIITGSLKVQVRSRVSVLHLQQLLIIRAD